MTAAREALVLPNLFLVVLLAGGLHVGRSTALVPPSPYVLVLGLLLLRVVVQSGTLAPEQLLATSRTTVANVNGAVLIATVWLAASQTFAALIPESGIPRLAFSVFFLILVLNTVAASPDRRRLLQSLAVSFGAAFVLKFVVLHGLSAPGEGALKRALLAVVDNVTAGALIQEVPHPSTAYVAFLTVGLFLIGLVLLPHREPAARIELPGGAFRTLPPA